MANCELCGKSESGNQTIIEGVTLNVCKDCSKFGKVIAAPKEFDGKTEFLRYRNPKKAEPESDEDIVEDFASKIKRKREEKRLTQQEFAKLLNEKESLIHGVENGSHKPSIDLARKLERILGIVLVEQIKEAQVLKTKGKVEAFTLGDFIKVKKSKE